MRKRYKSLETVSSWYFWGGVLTLIGGLALTAYLIYSGVKSGHSAGAATQFAMALGAFITTVVAGVTQIATGEAIELAIDIEGHLRESCEIQQKTCDLLRQDRA